MQAIDPWKLGKSGPKGYRFPSYQMPFEIWELIVYKI